MSAHIPLVVFRLDTQRYALELFVVERVVRAVEITPLPKAPTIVLGVIDMEGRVLPVFNIRQRVLLPEREINLTDQFLIARAGPRTVVIAVDEAQGIIERRPSDIIRPTQIVPGLEFIEGIVRLEDGLILIQDLEKFLSLDEARVLDGALTAGVAHGS